MKKVLVGFGLITVIGLICVLCGLLWASPGSGTWEEGTTNPFAGTFFIKTLDSLKIFAIIKI